MHLRYIVLAIFALTYLFLCASNRFKTAGLWVGIALMAWFGLALPGQDPDGALSAKSIFLAINWNVMGVLAGAMFIADLFLESGVPLLLADKIAARCRSTHMAMLGVCALAGAISAFVDNVTTVLLVAPVAIAISTRTNISPVPLLIGIAAAANLQGAATLVGDPPSMLTAAHFKLTFNDFFVYKGRPSLFFAIQLGALASFVVLYVIFRKNSRPTPPVETNAPKTWVPVGFILTMILFLALSSNWDPGFTWLAGTGNVVIGLCALVWVWRKHPKDTVRLLKGYNLRTIGFLAGIFVLGYEMNAFGWVHAIADGIAALVGTNKFAAYTLIVWVSVLVSAFVDNIAYVALMLPVTSEISNSVGGSPFLYAAGLLVGACLGGNITPIGASCNVVACGILERMGKPVTFWQFARIGLPFTLAATLAGYAFIWVFWR